MDRDEAIARIRKALRTRTGRDWSVTGGRGTAWGWITIEAPPRRRVDENGNTGASSYYTSAEDRATLAQALGLESVHFQGVSIPAASDYRQEYVDRAEGRAPSVIGQRYWD
jgi:hypothetical protein